MAKTTKTKKKSKQDDTSKAKGGAGTKAEEKAKAAAKAEEKAKAKAAAELAALTDEAKKARKTADKAVRAADKAQAAAVAAGAPAPKSTPSEADLLKLALRTSEAKLTDAERKVEALERQIADFHTLDDQVLQNTIEDAIVDAAVVATVEDAVVDAEVVAGALVTDPVEAEALAAETVAAELDEIIAEAEQEAAAIEPESSHEGDAAAAAAAFGRTDGGDEPTVTGTELTPPLPEQPADDEPSESWTLLRLRAEAKRRGLTGTSNLPKAALLSRLRAS
jgi:hypothetical protein